MWATSEGTGVVQTEESVIKPVYRPLSKSFSTPNLGSSSSSSSHPQTLSIQATNFHLSPLTASSVSSQPTSVTQHASAGRVTMIEPGGTKVRSQRQVGKIPSVQGVHTHAAGVEGKVTDGIGGRSLSPDKRTMKMGSKRKGDTDQGRAGVSNGLLLGENSSRVTGQHNYFERGLRTAGSVGTARTARSTGPW